MVGWFEIPVLNMNRAKKFYEKVFDIKIQTDQFGDTQMGFFPFPKDPQARGAGGSHVQNPAHYNHSDNGKLIYFSKEEITAVPDGQGDGALDNLVPEEVSAEDIPERGLQVGDTAQLDSGGIEAENVSITVDNEENVIETGGEVVESVVPAAEPEQEVLPALPPLEQETVILGFKPNATGLTIDADRVLTEFVETLLQYPDAKILVKGFVSSNNDTQENTQLSEKRAISVRKLLIDRGIREAQIEVIGMGIKDPIATNDTPAGRLKNRRVEIEIIDDGV